METIITRFSLLFVVAALIILGVTGNLFPSSPVVIDLQVLAVGLSFWARTSFPSGTFRVAATPASDTIIRRGPYRFIRHPMYSAALLCIWSAVLSHIGVLTLVVGLVITVVAVWRVILEERLLLKQYADYEDYVKETKALVPFLL